MARLEEGSVPWVETGMKKSFHENGRDYTGKGVLHAGGSWEGRDLSAESMEDGRLTHGKADEHSALECPDFPKVIRQQGAAGWCQVASMRSGFLIQGHRMLVNSFGSWVWEWWERKGNRAEGWLSSEEDDSRREKERERDVCLATGRQRLWGPRTVLTHRMGSLFECRFWFNGTGVRFWHF